MTGSGNIQERNEYLTAILTLPALALTGGGLGLLKSGDAVISIGSPFGFEHNYLVDFLRAIMYYQGSSRP
jgi:hypothetical protein